MPGAKTIVSSGPQVPPREFSAEAIDTGAPPVTSTFLSTPPEKNAIQRPSGEKKGSRTSSVPESGLDSSESSGRT